jgi:hypothetical protein
MMPILQGGSMRRFLGACLLPFLVTVFATNSLAEERVVKIKIEPGKTSHGNVIDGRLQHDATFNHTGGPNESDLSKLTFTVYTVEELNTRRTQDLKRTIDLETLTKILQRNVQDLAAANDALTKRIEEMENRTKP